MASQYDASNISLAGMSIHQVKSLSQDPTIQRELEKLDQYDPNDILPAHLVSSMEAIINQVKNKNKDLNINFFKSNLF